MTEDSWDTDPEVLEMEAAIQHLTIEELDQMVDQVEAIRALPEVKR